MFKTIVVYQIIIWPITLINLANQLLKSIFEKNLLIFGLSSVFILFSSFFIYINFCLLFNLKKNYFLRFLKINLWSNLFQVFHLSLFGLTYYIAIGIHVLLYYIYDTTQDVKIGFNYFTSVFGFNYHESSVIVAGINLIPLLLFVYFYRKLKSLESSNKTI